MSNELPNTSATRTHHPYGPSRLNHLDDCAGFQSRPGSNDAADEGTFLHERMEELLQKVASGKASLLTPHLADVAQKHELSDDQLACLRFCCRKMDALLSRYPSSVKVEVKVTVKDDGAVLTSGYFDALLLYGSNIGVLVDFKFGSGTVRHARENLQGVAYALGAFQAHPTLEKIGVCFVQPRRNEITEHVLSRAEMPVLLGLVKDVIHRAEMAKANPESAQQFMEPGDYCRYCARAGTCGVVANHLSVVGSHMAKLPVPTTFSALEITSPEQIALARFWVDVVESGIKGIKERALELAKANGGEISCILPNGETVRYTVETRQTDRVLGSAVEVAEALQSVVTPQEVLAAADLSIGKLEKVVKASAVELARARGEKLTKKAAWEQAESLLSALGLLSRPDTRIEFLKRAEPSKNLLESSKTTTTTTTNKEAND